MAFGVKTNERPGTRAQVRHLRVSAYKAREVLDLIRGKHVQEADDILRFLERDVAIPIRKLLASAVANAAHNDEQDPEALFVSACYADEGPTMKRWRPRSRGRAGRIRKRTCHITIIVSRLDEDSLRRWRDSHAAATSAGRRRGARADRAARVARSRAQAHDHDHDHDHEVEETVDATEAVEVEDVEVEGAEAEAVEAEETIEADEAPEDAAEDAADDEDDDESEEKS